MLLRKKHMNTVTMQKIIEENRHPKGIVTVEFDDGLLDMDIRHALIHLPFWQMYIDFNMPVYKRHILHADNSFSRSSIETVLSTIYNEILEYYNDDIDMAKFKDILWNTLNFLDSFGIEELNEYHKSLSALQLCTLLAEPNVKNIVDVNITPNMSTAAIEKTLSDKSSELLKVTSKKGEVNNNCLLDFQQTKILNNTQLSQALIMLGLRTEINEKLIKVPIYGSAISGMRDVRDYMIEIQSVRKAMFYSKSAIKDSQYWNRKLQLVTNAVSHIYPGSCGTSLTVPFLITETNYKNITGKIIRLEDGKDIALSEKNIQDFIGLSVNLYSPLTCKYTDGVCEKCFGRINKNIHRDINIGILAASKTTSQVSQMILSTKHFNTTRSKLYKIPNEANEILEKTNLGINFKKEVLANPENGNWYLGVPIDNIKNNIYDVLHMSIENYSPEERFSSIEIMHIKNKNGEVTDYVLEVEEQSPFFSIEFLLYIKLVFSDLIFDETTLWIPMNRCKNIPIFKTAILSDSMNAYFKRVLKFLENGILAKYKDLPGALAEFSDRVYNKVNLNLIWLEIVLKAHLITSDLNVSIPEVTDINDVIFSTTENIFVNRSISAEFAAQGLAAYLSDPKTFSVVKDTSSFDKLFGM